MTRGVGQLAAELLGAGAPTADRRPPTADREDNDMFRVDLDHLRTAHRAVVITCQLNSDAERRQTSC
ncbi:MAG TPA: hypothetical protein VLM79_16980 [Kofleriaceae bacterium]|nr:hypothetical protein [Kofleriaceae bacterium]